MIKKNFGTVSLLLLFFCGDLLAQDLPAIRTRLTELSAFSSILSYEDRNWSYENFKKRINDSNGAFLRENPRPTSADIKTDLIQQVFFFLRNQKEEVSSAMLHEQKDRLYKTLSWWIIDKPQFRWTDSALDQPRYVGAILLLLYDIMKADESDPRYASRIRRIKEEAANYLWYSWNHGKSDDRFISLGDDLSDDVRRMGNVGYRLFAMTAIATALDREDLMTSISYIVNNQFQFQINTGSNYPVALMPDFAFHQHNIQGGQLYNLGYGLDWFNDFVAYAYYVKDTQWALTDYQLGILTSFLERGVYPFFVENGQLVQQALGRHNQVQSSWIKFPENRARLLMSFFSKDSEQHKAIENVLSDLNFEKNTGFHAFYTSDFLIADLPKYKASVRLVSDRTSGQESGDFSQKNGMLNFFSSDGSFLHYLPDFDEVKGAWDWRKVPGTTAALINYPLPIVPYGKNYAGFSSYSGVLATEKGALIAGNLRRKSGTYQLEMVKSYLLLPNVVLFWGFGLKYEEKNPVNTTITQERTLEDAFILSGSNKQLIRMGSDTVLKAKKPIAIWNGETGYVIFPTGEVGFHLEISSQLARTKWEFLDERNKELKNELPLLTVGVKHIENSQLISDSYFYVMVPKISEQEFTSLYNLGEVDFASLGIGQLKYSTSCLSLVHKNEAWFVNFKNAANSEFSLAGIHFSVKGLLGGAVYLDNNNLQFNLSQMEKRNTEGQDFLIKIDNYQPKSISQVETLSKPLRVRYTQSGFQILGNTQTKNSLNFGSTFRFDISQNPH